MKVILIAPIPKSLEKAGGGIGNWVNIIRQYSMKHPDLSISYVDTKPAKNNSSGRTLWQRVVVQGKKMFELNKQLKKQIKEDKPDVIHITTSGELASIRDYLFLKTAQKYGIKTVYHMHFGRIGVISKENTLEWKFLKRALRIASAIIAIDETSYNALEIEFPQKNILNIPNPIDIQKIRSTLEVNNDYNAFSILYLGWMVKTKGVEELIDAWSRVYQDFPGHTLDLVGPGENEYMEQLREQSKKAEGTIHIWGMMDHTDAMLIMSKCKIFILPSYTEGFPNVILEAMALEKPIIATSVGAIPEMLSNECGVIINPKNSKDIEVALRALLDNPKCMNEISKNAFAKVKELYDVDIIIPKYLEVWKNC